MPFVSALVRPSDIGMLEGLKILDELCFLELSSPWPQAGRPQGVKEYEIWLQFSTPVAFEPQQKLYDIHSRCSKCPPFAATQAPRASLYREKIRTVEESQHHITDEWERLDQRVIDNVVMKQLAGDWRKRLHACIGANSGHF